MRARPRRLPWGSRRGFLLGGTFSWLCLLWVAVHPIRRQCTPSDRVYRDVTGVSRRNGCKAAVWFGRRLVEELGGTPCRVLACC